MSPQEYTLRPIASELSAKKFILTGINHNGPAALKNRSGSSVSSLINPRLWQDPSRSNLMVTMPISALRLPSKKDQGIGKFTYIAPFYRDTLKPAGFDGMIIHPPYAIISERPYAPACTYALNEDFIDWSEVEEVKENPLLLGQLIATGAEQDEIDYDLLREREHRVGMSACIEFNKKQIGLNNERAKEYMEFVKENNFWLKGYARFMALHRLIPGKAFFQWTAADIVEAKADQRFNKLAAFHKYAQWIAQKRQLQPALRDVYRYGGIPAFDIPMFRAKDSLDAWMNRRYFKDVDDLQAYPGIVISRKGDDRIWRVEVDARWQELALWNWKRLSDENFEFMLGPIRYWLNFGFAGARIDAGHFAYKFSRADDKWNVEQLGSGDEPGDAYVEALGSVFKELNRFGLVEAYEGQGHNFSRRGFFVSGYEWKKISDHDDTPQKTKEAPRFSDTEDTFIKTIKEALAQRPRFISVALGHHWGDPRPIKEYRLRQGVIDCLWHYRIPLPDDKQRRPFDAGPRLAQLSPVPVSFKFYPRTEELPGPIESAYLAGDFNNWSQQPEFQMKKDPPGPGWRVTVDLRPGTYQYKFKVSFRDEDDIAETWLSYDDDPFNRVGENANKNYVIEVKPQKSSSAGEKSGSWLSENAPEVEDYSVVSLQVEAGLDPGIIERMLEANDEELVRFATQVTMTGGLGALIRDLVCGWKKNGADITAIHPLYSIGIKGEVFHYDEQAERMIEGTPDLGRHKNLGEMIKEGLEKTEISYTLDLNCDAFFQRSENEKSRNAWGRTVRVDVYTAKTKFGGAPLYYLDAYYFDGAGEKVYIFDELYPDNDFREVQMAVYNEASQMLVETLQKEGILKQNLMFVENEVYVSCPKERFPNAVRHHINHTVWKPGMYRPHSYAFELLGFHESLRKVIVRDGKIDLAEYAGTTADIITGVSLFEHTKVLKSKIFENYRHRVKGYSRAGMRSTNAVLLEHWQGLEIRALLNKYKVKLGMDHRADDIEFFDKLDLDDNQKIKEEFKRRLELIKALYVLDLLIMLHKTQKQGMGGSGWLADTLEGSGYDIKGIDKIRDIFKQYIIEALLEEESIWGRIDGEFSKLKDILLENPIIANARRWVGYKAPDKYEEIFSYFSANPKALIRFKDSGSKIILGGRQFGNGAKAAFERCRDMAKRLGLENQIAFVENYNLLDAPAIYHGVAATVMLSEEFLEASASSMMKGLVNGAALIGVLGGAIPELFVIVNKKTGDIVDILAEEISPEELEKRVRAGKDQIYRIKNGYLVKYSSIEKSREEGGGRRPSAKSLFSCIINVGKKYKNPDSRKGMMFESIKSSLKADIERSQSRAHIKLWQEAIKDRGEFDNLVASLRSAGADEKIMEIKIDNGFQWNFKKDPRAKWILSLDSGEQHTILDFMDSFRRVRANANGLNSFRYHCSGENLQGDHIAFLQFYLEKDPSLAPLKSILDEYAARIEAVSLEGDYKKVVQAHIEKAHISFEAMDFADRVIRAMLDKDYLVKAKSSSAGGGPTHSADRIRYTDISKAVRAAA